MFQTRHNLNHSAGYTTESMPTEGNEELNDLIILKPHWVTEYFNMVLESKEVIKRAGVFTRSHMDELWTDLAPALRHHFLRLMERFDLSYRTPDNRERSVVVERLPLDPFDYGPQWDAVKTCGQLGYGSAFLYDHG